MNPLVDFRVPRPLVAAALVNWAVGLWVYLSGVRVWRGNLVDDAFITFRYAQNIARGHGIVWNPGGERTEGYTSPLQVFLLVPVEFLGIDPLVFMKVIGVLAVGAAIPFLLFLCIHGLEWRGNTLFQGLALLAPGTWLMFHPNVIHSVSGMETSLVMVLYLAYGMVVSAAVQSARATGSVSLRKMACLLALAIMILLVRSESGAIAVGGLVVLLFWRESRRAGLQLLGGLFGFLLLYLLWKKMYFGYVLPNPYYHKVAPEGVLFPGFWDVFGFINHHLWIVLLPAAGWMLCPPSRERPIHPLELYALGGFLFYVLFFLRVEHIMGFDFRFLWHAMPFLAVLAIFGLKRIGESWGTGATGEVALPARSWLAWGGVMVGLVVFLVGTMMRHPVDSSLYAAFRRPIAPPPALNLHAGGYRAHWRIGHLLQDLDLSADTVVQGAEAGIIPYLAGVWSIDTVGLNDNTITRGTREEREAYLAAHPIDIDYSVSTTGAIDDFAAGLDWVAAQPQEVQEWSRGRFSERVRDYHYAGNFYWWIDERRQEFVLWVRKSHPRAEEITHALRAESDNVREGALRFGPYPPEVMEQLRFP